MRCWGGRNAGLAAAGALATVVVSAAEVALADAWVEPLVEAVGHEGGSEQVLQ